MSLPYEIENAPHYVQEHYKKMIADGQTERFAVMCSLGIAPTTKGSDRTFMEGRLNNEWMDSMPPEMARKMAADAKKAGINTSGKFYMGGIADKRAHRDPEAWVDSVADVKRVAEKRGMHVRGSIEHTPSREAPPKRVEFNKKRLAKYAKEEQAKDSKLTRGEAEEIVLDRHVPKWKRKKK